MAFCVAVAGCTGYAGGEVVRLLAGHPEVELGALTAHSSAGARLGEFHSNLGPLTERIVQPTEIELLNDADAIILALPHGASAPIAAQLGEDRLVLDCGADFRLSDERAWRAFYDTDYAGCWPYGLPEMPGQRQVLAEAKRIAVPGCYPTTVTLALLPALTSGLITGRDVTVAAASGTSGAGKTLKPHLLGTELFNSMSAYGVGGVHRHVPEIEQNMRALGATEPNLSFTPILAPMPRGILAVVTAPIAPELSEAELRSAYEQAYAAETFCTLLPAGQWPRSKSVLGSNGFQVQVAIDRRAGRMVAVGTLDNLTKGTAGGAVQSMNIALGLPEGLGLNTIGVAP